MATVYSLLCTKGGARILNVVLTQPDRERDLREAAKVLEIDRLIREVTGEYDKELESLVTEARRLSRKFAGRFDNVEYITDMEAINTRIEQLDEEADTEDVELLLDSSQFTFIKDKFFELKGVPADRKNGPKYQTLRAAIEAAKKVEVKKAEDLDDV